MSDELRTASLDGAVQAKLSMMSGDAAENFKAISQTLETNFGPGVRRAAEQALTLGTPLADTAATLAAAGVDLGQFTSMIENATEGDPSDLLDNLAGLEQMLGDRFADPTTRQIAMLGMVSDVGEGVAESFGKMAPLLETLAEDGGVLNRYATAHENVIAAMESEDYGDAITNELLRGGQQTEETGFDIRKTLLSALVDEEGGIASIITQSAAFSTKKINELLQLAFDEAGKGITSAEITAQKAMLNAPLEIKMMTGMLPELGGFPISQLIDFTDYNAALTAAGRDETQQKFDRTQQINMNNPEIQRILAEAVNQADVNKDAKFNEKERDKFVEIFNMLAESADLQNIQLKKMNKQLAGSVGVVVEG